MVEELNSSEGSCYLGKVPAVESVKRDFQVLSDQEKKEEKKPCSKKLCTKMLWCRSLSLCPLTFSRQEKFLKQDNNDTVSTCSVFAVSHSCCLSVLTVNAFRQFRFCLICHPSAFLIQMGDMVLPAGYFILNPSAAKLACCDDVFVSLA